jgi:hypothetical protein
MTALPNYELRITMATNYTERKIEMICGDKSEHSEQSEIKKEMSSKVYNIEELLNKMDEAKHLPEDSDSEDEEQAPPADRWNNPIQRCGEATKVQLIKDIIADLKATNERTGIFPMTYKGNYVLGVMDETGEFNYGAQRTFGFAFTSWLILNEHKLDGNGGNWCSGCFGSFWADIALTIPQLEGVYYGCRISLNPNPKAGKESFFLVSICEKLKTRNPLKLLLQQSSACFPQYGPQVNWGAEWADRSDAAEKAAKEEKYRVEAERKAKKEEKEAQLRAEHEERRKQEEERKAKFAAERALIEQQQDAERKAAFAARVAEVAKKEEAAKEQMRLAKEEKARVAEEAAKLKREQKEAERLAKFVNKKK